MPNRCLGIFAIMLAAGCSDPYSVDDYVVELAEVHCQRMLDCCTNDEYVDWWTSAVGTQDCKTVWQSQLNVDDVHDALDDGRVTFDPAAAHACLEALRVQACGEFEPAYRYRETYCAASLRGRVADGGACALDVECESTRCTRDGSGVLGGHCTPVAGRGEVCGNGVRCEAPDACQADGRCGPGLPAGETCKADSECIDDWCQIGSNATQGTCVRACDGQ